MPAIPLVLDAPAIAAVRCQPITPCCKRNALPPTDVGTEPPPATPSLTQSPSELRPRPSADRPPPSPKGHLRLGDHLGDHPGHAAWSCRNKLAGDRHYFGWRAIAHLMPASTRLVRSRRRQQSHSEVRWTTPSFRHRPAVILMRRCIIGLVSLALTQHHLTMSPH